MTTCRPSNNHLCWRLEPCTGILLLSWSLLLVGCSKPDVRYSDLRPATTATVHDDLVVVHLGSDLNNSACWTIPKARREGQTIYLSGWRTLQQQSHEFAVHLPASRLAVTVIWVDPDGNHVTVPFTK